MGEKLIPQGSLLSLKHHFVRSQWNLFCSSKWGKKNPVYEIIFEYLTVTPKPSSHVLTFRISRQSAALLVLL